MQIPPFLLDEWLNHYHFASTPPQFDLASSTGPISSTRDILKLMTPAERERFDEAHLIYSAATGSERLRQAIADLHGVGVNEVQVVTGASEALLILFFIAAEAGANVLLPFPGYPPTAVEARLLGLETRFYHLRRENDFQVDVDEIKKLTDARTKLLLINSPHNPTGGTVSNAQMRELHDFAVDRGIPFVSDEVYHPIYHGEETSSAAVLSHATVVGSFSKALSLSGLRVGWIIDRDAARQHQYMDARGYFTISNSPLAEDLALVALRHRDSILARTRSTATANLRLLDQFFAEWEDTVGWVRPRGGTICFSWLKGGVKVRELGSAVAGRVTLLAPGYCVVMQVHLR